MIKTRPATCVNGKVTCDGVEITPVTILSQGVGASSGVLYIDGAECYYVAKTTPDLDTLLEKLISALDQVVTGLNQTAAGTIGGFPLSTTAAITAAATQVTVQKNALETLKGQLK